MPQAGQHVIFLANAFFGPLYGNVVITGESLDPVVVIDGALPQDLLGDGADTLHVAEKVHDVFRAREKRQMAEDDDTVETVVYESQQAAKQSGKFFHRSSSSPALGWHREHGTEGRWRSKLRLKITPAWTGESQLLSPAVRRARGNFKYFWVDLANLLQRAKVTKWSVKTAGAKLSIALAKPIVLWLAAPKLAGPAMAASMLATAFPVDFGKQDIPGRAVDPASDATKPANMTVAEARTAVGTNPSPTTLAAMASRFAKPKVLACRP